MKCLRVIIMASFVLSLSSCDILQPEEHKLEGRSYTIRELLRSGGRVDSIPSSHYRSSVRLEDYSVRLLESELSFTSNQSFQISILREYHDYGESTRLDSVIVTGRFDLEGYLIFFDPDPKGFSPFLGVAGPSLDDFSTITLHGVTESLFDDQSTNAFRFATDLVDSSIPEWRGKERSDSQRLDLKFVRRNGMVNLPFVIGATSHGVNSLVGGSLELEKGFYEMTVEKEICALSEGPGCKRVDVHTRYGDYVRGGQILHFEPRERYEFFGIEYGGITFVFEPTGETVRCYGDCGFEMRID